MASYSEAHNYFCLSVHVSDRVCLEPNKEYVVSCFVDDHSDLFDGKPLFFSPSSTKLEQKSVLAGSALVTPINAQIPVPLINLSSNLVWLEPNTSVGTIESILEVKSINSINK